MKHAQTAAPKTRARTHRPWSRWPSPGKSHAAVPISHALAGALSLVSKLSISALLKLTSIEFQIADDEMKPRHSINALP